MLVVYKFSFKGATKKIVWKTLIFKYKLFIQATTTWINIKKTEWKGEREKERKKWLWINMSD